MLSFHGEFSPADLTATLEGLGTNVSFVQIGAMDGVAFDPIHALTRKNNWHGVLVEPMPDMFEKLKANKAGCEGLRFVNAAVADYDGTIEMTRIDPAACAIGALPQHVLGISTLMPDRGIIGGKTSITPEAQVFLDQYRRTLEVPCLTLSTLLKQEQVEKIDAFIVDTEGADWMVTRQLDLDLWQPRLVYIEYDHITMYEKIACANHFINHGYRIFVEKASCANFLAIRK